MATKIELAINDLRERLIRIEEHLKNMNGKLIKHEELLSETCPDIHKEIDKRFDSIEKENAVNNLKIIAITAFIVLIISIAVQKFFG